jgi:phosphatidylserine/phosphatidylglycerophosphate/cardiolipin synthase-like enzyme
MKKHLQMILPIVICLLATPILSHSKEPITNYQVLFSPDDHVADELIALIKKEQKSIKAAIYCLMHRGIVKALIDAKNRGVQVEVIIDPFSTKARVPIKKMQEAKLSVYVWNPPPRMIEGKKKQKVKKRQPLMHDKFCILGDRLVWTGSFNFTFKAATVNRENVVILENKEIASCYLKEFDQLKKIGCQTINEYMTQLSQSTETKE